MPATRQNSKKLQDEAASIKSATIQVNNSGESLSTKKAKLEALQKKMDELLKEGRGFKCFVTLQENFFVFIAGVLLVTAGCARGDPGRRFPGLDQ